MACKTGYWINAGEGSVIRDNVAIACGSNHGAADLKTYENDPGFVNQAAMNLALREDAAVYADVSGFEPIPFAQIGLYADEFRATVPAYRREMTDWTPGRDASWYDILDRE